MKCMVRLPFALCYFYATFWLYKVACPELPVPSLLSSATFCYYSSQSSLLQPCWYSGCSLNTPFLMEDLCSHSSLCLEKLFWIYTNCHMLPLGSLLYPTPILRAPCVLYLACRVPEQNLSFNLQHKWLLSQLLISLSVSFNEKVLQCPEIFLVLNGVCLSWAYHFAWCIENTLHTLLNELKLLTLWNV